MKKLTRALALLLAAAMAFALVSCGSSTTESTASASEAASVSEAASASEEAAASEPAAKKEVTIGLYGNTDTVTPFDTIKVWCDAGGDGEAQFIYDSLYYLDENNEYVSRIIDTAEWVDDTHLDITLKDGIYFSNGQQMTGEDVLYSLEIAQGATMVSDADLNVDIANCSYDGLNIHLAFLSTYAIYQDGLTTAIYCKSFIEENGGGENMDWYTTDSICGSGPYAVTNYVQDMEITFELRDDYWGTAYGYEMPYDTLTLKLYTDATTMVVDFENGALDAVTNITEQDFSRLDTIEDDNIQTYTVGCNNVYMLCFDSNNNEYLKDIAVREAICHAINQEDLAYAVGGIYGVPAYAPLSVHELGYSGDYDYSYDPDLAKQILTDAGYSEGEISLVMYVPAIGANTSMGEVIQAELAAIGINMDLEAVEIQTYINAVRTPGGTDLKVDNKGGGNPTCDPATHLDNFADSTDPVQYREHLVDVIHAANSTYDIDERTELYTEMQDLMYENYDLCPLFELNYGCAYNTDVFADFNLTAVDAGYFLGCVLN